jgi:serine/threonine protein kinase
MPLAPGDQLGPYEIVAPIGKGGMGEVYRARDPRMGRDVAIKISAGQFSERFSREVRAIGSLNHPNICHLYDVGPNFLVMELVEGATLAERIKDGPIPLEESIAIATQIGDALEAAHEKGITHRDLKPGNVIVKDDGTVKVLDFGLAKVANVAPVSGSDPEQSPTISMHATQAGVILGTAAYMAPEQARGKPVNKRADIWAFGVVLYEMLTGKRLFKGENLTDTLASVVKEQPDLSAAPTQVRRLLARCLEKDPKKRLRDIGDVWESLDQVPTKLAPAPLRPYLAWLAWTAPVLLVSTTVFAYLWLRTPPPETRSAQFEINPPLGMPFTDPYDRTAISPDGRYIVFGADDQGKSWLWLRPLDSLAARRLPGTEDAHIPFWSPDSKSIGFYQDGKIKRSDIAGGAPLALCDYAPNAGEGGTWNRDGTILFASGPDILRVSASGGVPQHVTMLDPARKESGSGFPQFLPDGKHFLYQVASTDPRNSGIFAASLDRPKERVWIMAADRKASYTPPRNGLPGYLLWMRERTLLAQPFDAGKLKLEGGPEPVLESVATEQSNPSTAFWTSDTGVLAYWTPAANTLSSLTWFDRQGNAVGAVGKTEAYAELALSPDGSQIAAYRGDAVGDDLWLIDARGSSSRLTTDPAAESHPVWSPDGKQVAFARFYITGGVRADLYRKPASIAGAEELLLKDGSENWPSDWSPDGRFLLFIRRQIQTWDLWVLPMGEGERKPVKYLATQFRERSGTFSPDGRWVMYVSNVSGREEVYVSPFPDAAAAPAVLVSTEGGTYPHWRRDGKAAYYLSPDLKLMEVEVLPSSTFKVGIPKPLFQTRTRPSNGDPSGWTWDISPNGQRFLFNIPDDRQNVAPLTVITNWQSKLKK